MSESKPTTPTNTPATISMVAGIFSCVPGAGIVAIIAGLLGLRRARRGTVGGFVMSALGMMLGMAGTTFWIVLPLSLYRESQFKKAAAPYIETTRLFLMQEVAGNISNARPYCAPELTSDKLTDLVEKLNDFGDLHEIRSGTGGDMRNPGAVQINALIVFKNSTQNFTGIWKTIDGQPRLYDYKLDTTDPDPSTQPAATQPGSTQPAGK